MAEVEYQALKKYEKELIECLEGEDLVSLARQATEWGLVPISLETNLKSLHHQVPHPLKCRYLFYNVYQNREFNRWITLLSKLKVTIGVLSEIKQCRDKKGSFDQEKRVIFTKTDVSDLSKFLASYAYKWNEIASSLMLPIDQIKKIALLHLNNPDECLNEVLHAWVTCKFPDALPPTLEVLEKALLSRTVGLGREVSKLRESTLVKNMLASIISTTDEVSKRFQIVSQTMDLSIPEGSSHLLEIQVNSILYHPTFEWLKDGEVIRGASVVDSNALSYVAILLVKAENLLAEGICTCRISCNRKVFVSKPMHLSVITPVDEYQKNLVDFYTEQPEVPEDAWPPVSSNTFISLALIKQDSIHHAGEYGRGTIQGDIDDIYNDKESITYKRAFGGLKSGMRLLIEGRPGSGKTTLVHKITKDWANNLLLFPNVRLVILIHLRAFSSDPSLDLNNILNCYFWKQADKNIISDYAGRHSGLGFCFVVDGLDEYLPNNKNAYIFQLIEKKVLPKAIVIVASRPAAAAPFRSKVNMQVEVIGFLKEQISDYIRNYPAFSDHKCRKLFQYLDQHPNVHHMCYLPIHAAIVCFLFNSLGVSLPETETQIYTEFTKSTILRMLYRSEEHSEICIESFEDLPAPQRDLYHKVCEMAYEMCKSSKQIMPQSAVKSFFNARDDAESLGLITIDKLALRSGFNKMFSFLHLTFQEYLGAYHIASLYGKRQLELIAEWGKARHMQQVWKFFCGLAKFGDQYRSYKVLTENTEYGGLFKVQCCFESRNLELCDSAIEHNSLTFKDTVLNLSNFTEISFVLSNAFHNPVLALSFEGCVFGRECVDVLVEKAKGKLSLLTSLRHYQCKQFEVLTYFMQHLPSLEVLDISDSALTVEEVVSHIKNLSYDNLQFLKIGNRGNVSNSLLKQPQTLANAFVSNCGKCFNICFSGARKDFIASKLPFHFDCDFINVHLSNKLGIAGARVLSAGFTRNSFLTCLTLNDCGIDNKTASILALGLMHCSHLEILDLGFNSIGNAGAIDIANRIVSCTKLFLLNLVHNDINDSGALALAHIFKGDIKKILLAFNSITHPDLILQANSNVHFHKLDNSKTNLGDAGTEWLVSTIQSSHCSCSEILQLNLPMNNLSHIAMKHLSSVLVQCSNLLILDLSSNSLSVEGAKILSGALQHCVKLHSLDVSSNFLSTDAVRNIARVLKCCTNLLQFKANSNSISSDGVSALVEGLMYCTILQELEIRSNHIQCGGAEALGLAFFQRCWTNFFVLDISCNDIASEGIKALADGLVMCTSLQELYVSHNNIGSEGASFLSYALKNFSNFQALDISYNDLQSSGAQVIADALCHSTSLHTFNISNNNIEREGAQHLAYALECWTRISELNVSSNDLQSRGASLLTDALITRHYRGCSLSHVRKLDLSANMIMLLDQTSIIVDVLKYCTNLQELHFYNNHLDISCLNALTGVFESSCCNTLQILNLSSTSLGCDGVEVLAKGLVHCEQLLELYISNNKIGNTGATVLADSLKHLKNLKVLDVSMNDICNIGIASISSALKGCTMCTMLYNLNLSGNRIIWSIADSIVFSTLQELRTLRTLTLSDMDLGTNGVIALASGLKFCVSLERLALSYNNIDVSGAKALASALKFCASLRVLDVSHNPFGIEGINSFAAAIKYCPYICELNFNECHEYRNMFEVIILDCQHLSKLYMSGCPSNNIAPASFFQNLTELHIAGCSITPNRVKILFQDLVKIHLLDISRNPFEDDGAVALAVLVRNYTVLHTLLISEAKIGTRGAVALSEALKFCTCLSHLDVRFNPLETEGVLALKQSLKHCTRLNF